MGWIGHAEPASCPVGVVAVSERLAACAPPPAPSAPPPAPSAPNMSEWHPWSHHERAPAGCACVPVPISQTEIAQLDADGVHLLSMRCFPHTATCRIDAHGKPTSKAALPNAEDAVGVPPTYVFVFTLGASLSLVASLLEDDAALPDAQAASASTALAWALRAHTLSHDRLEELALRLTRLFTSSTPRGGAPSPAPISETCWLLRHVPLPAGLHEAARTVQLCDASTSWRYGPDAAAVLTTVDGEARSRGPLLVQPIGDALVSPSWYALT
jgi:hypothetical protein